MGKVISLKDLKQIVFEGEKELYIKKDTILTPSAKDFALTGAIKLIVSDSCAKADSSVKSTEKEKTATREQIKNLVTAVSKEKNIKLCENDLNKVIDEVFKYVNK